MPGVYVGETKSLVFPMLCDGYINLDYSEMNPTDTDLSLRAGVWSPRNSFTLEAILTPYDVNGYGSHTTGQGTLDSQKTSPRLGATESNLTHYQSNKRFGTSQNNQKMSIFYNTNLHLYLENTTTTNINQPSEWKIVADFPQASNATRYVETPTLIKSHNTLHGYYDETAYYDGISTSLKRIATSATNALPFQTSSIDSTSLSVDTETPASAATATVSFSGGDPEAYWSAVGSTATITGQNNFPTSELDTMPVREKGYIKFNGQPNAASNQTTDCIAITNEAGTVTIKLFFQTSGTNGDALSTGNGWPANSYLVRPEATLVLTARNIVGAIAGVSGFWAGNMDYGTTEPSNVYNDPAFRVIQLKSAFTGSAPNRVGDTSASVVDGGSFITNNSDFAITQFAGGINEDEKSDFYISVNDGSNTKKYTPFRDISNTVSPDVNYPATGATYTRSGGTTVVSFRRKGGLDATMSELKNAINNNTTGQGSALTAAYNATTNVLTITKNTAGTSGDASGAITKTNIADTRVTIGNSGNFANGRNLSEPTKYIQLRDKSDNLIKFHGVRQDYDPTINTGDTLTYGGNDYIAFRLPYGTVSGSTQITLFRQAVNTQTHSTDFDISMTGSTLTAGTVGAAGNGTNTENLSNTTVNNFTGGADASSTTVDKYVQITSADGSSIKFKAATLGSQTTGSTGGGYTYFQIGSSTTTAAANLITAINASSLNSKLTASSPSSNNEFKIQNSIAGGGYAITDNYSNIDTSAAWQTGNQKVISSITTTNIGVGESIYDSSGVLIGTVATRDSSSQITLVNNPVTTITSTLYASQPREALYLDSVYKITLTYNDTTGKVELLLNNSLQKSATVSILDNDANDYKFEFDASDCKIGQSTNNTTQFYGELYEIAMSNRISPSITSTTLSPGLSDIIFYYRFDE